MAKNAQATLQVHVAANQRNGDGVTAEFIQEYARRFCSTIPPPLLTID
jgi:hypothetical protein